MRFISKNKLSDFEFHDAQFALEVFDNNILAVKARYLNIHKDTEQNSFETDMEIESAIITFEKFKLISYESRKPLEQYENGALKSNELQLVFMEHSAYSCFYEQLKAGLTVLDFGVKECDIYFLDAMSKDPVFTVCFTFENVSIEWDEYKKEAWYVSR